jgi:hypothetical protein
MQAIHSTLTSILIEATRCNISEDGTLHSHLHEHLKSYTMCKLKHDIKSMWYVDADWINLLQDGAKGQEIIAVINGIEFMLITGRNFSE